MAANSGSAVRITTGQLAWDGGVDSGRIALLKSAANPNGLKPNQLAWANSATMRDGCIAPRPGFEYVTTMPIVDLFQDAFVYEPSGEFPYLVAQIGGRTWRTIVTSAPAVTDEITIPGDPNSALIDQNWMCQGEEFLVIQDNNSNPLFWDGNTMRRSLGASVVLGIVNVAAVVPAVGSPVLLTLNSPFLGQNGEIVYINGKAFQVTTDPGTVLRLQPSTSYYVGSVIAAGAIIQTRLTDPSPHTLIATTTAAFTVPASGVPVEVALDPPYTGALPVDVSLFDKYGGYGGATGVPPGAGANTTEFWQLIASALPAPGANQVYVTNVNGVPGDPIAPGDLLESTQELPAGQSMDYYMGRLWVANGRQYIAGDIVGSRTSGTAQYGYRDSILAMTENAFTVSGGAFIVPSNAGNIRALKHPANLNTALGEGQLLPMTRRNIYSTNVVPDRAAWATLSEPLQRVAQINFGTVSDRSVVTVNGDLYYQSVDGVRSFTQSISNFNAGPGNVAISNEEARAINLNDRSLLRFATGIELDNRLLQSCLPYQTPVGVAHKGVMPLNFDLLSTQGVKVPPAWEGMWEGLPFLKLLKGDFGGRQRAFAYIWSEVNQAIEIWEITTDALEDRIADAQIVPAVADSEHARIQWSFETPAFDWGNPFQMKELDTVQFWVDRLSGTVEFTLEYRPDQYPCWTYYHHWTECAARNECELPNPLMPCDHPQQAYLPQYRELMTMPKPPSPCNEIMRRPLNQGYSFQFRLTIKGYCRIRGILVHALPRESQPYYGLVCNTNRPTN